MEVNTRQTKAYEEIIELFADGSSAERMISFKPSKESQERVAIKTGRVIRRLKKKLSLMNLVRSSI